MHRIIAVLLLIWHQSVIQILDFIWLGAKKCLRDLALTLYDDFDFKYISLPRVIFALASMCVIISWVGNQFFGYKFDGFTQLVAWATSCAGAYGVKKYIEGGRDNG